MARDHARMQTGLWDGEDWRALTLEGQWAYEMLCQQQALSYAGVIDFRPTRWAVLSTSATPKRVNLAIRELEKTKFVVVDRATEELLVRSYVRHDGVMERANMGKAVARAYFKIVSLTLRKVVIEELSRLYGAKPHLAGFGGIAELFPEVMDNVSAMSSTIPFPIASGK